MARTNTNNHSDDMSVDELIGKIYEFEGNAEEWLEFEKEVREIIKNFSDAENEILTDSEAMESLTMVCEGIRANVKKLKELEKIIFEGDRTDEEWLRVEKEVEEAWGYSSDEEKRDFEESGAGDMLGQIIEFL